MNIESAFNSGVAGYNQATQRVSESANNIAQQNNQPQTESPTEIAQAAARTQPVEESLINLRVAEHEAQASVSVIEAADDVLGSLIDTRA